MSAKKRNYIIIIIIYIQKAYISDHIRCRLTPFTATQVYICWCSVLFKEKSRVMFNPITVQFPG